MVDTKIIYLLISYRKLIFDLGQNGGHFGFLRFKSTLLKFQVGSQANVDYWVLWECHAKFGAFIRQISLFLLSYLTINDAH